MLQKYMDRLLIASPTQKSSRCILENLVKQLLCIYSIYIHKIIAMVKKERREKISQVKAI